MDGSSVTYFHSIEAKHFSKEIKRLMGNKNITANIYRMKTYKSIMCGYFCIDILFKGKSLTCFLISFNKATLKKNFK